MHSFSVNFPFVMFMNSFCFLARYECKSNFSRPVFNFCKYSSTGDIKTCKVVSSTFIHCLSSHGKGACDGLGGTLKSLAARASVQRTTNPIQTPKELFEWANKALNDISLQFVTNEDYIKEEKKLETRFKMALTVKGTFKYHCVIPITEKKATAKHFSLQKHSAVVKVMK